MSKATATRLKSIIYELTRIGEWWLLTFGLLIFAFVPHVYRANNDSISWANVGDLFTTAPLYMAIIVTFAAEAFLFAANDFFDRHVDALDERKKERNPVCAGRVTEREVWAILAGTGAVTVIFSAYFSIATMIFSIITLFIFYFYTAEPLRFKNKFLLDVLSHGFFVNTYPYIFVLVALWDFANGALLLLAIIVMRSTIAQMLQEIRDYEVDKKVEHNTVVVLGKKKAAYVILIIFSLITFGSIAFISYDAFVANIELSHFYLIIPFLCLPYFPIFWQLPKKVDDQDFIEELWMGQGRTTRNMAAIYAFVFISFILISIFVFKLQI